MNIFLHHNHKSNRVLPFDVLGFDCDNGGELLNYMLLEYFTNKKNPVQYTRSREYKKNDNAHIEEKNWTQLMLDSLSDTRDLIILKL